MRVHLGWKDTSEVPVAGGKDWAPDMGTLCQHAALTPIPWATFADKPRNVGHTVPWQFGQCVCSPAPDPFGHRGAWTSRQQRRERPAVSLSPFLRVGQEGEAT